MKRLILFLLILLSIGAILIVFYGYRLNNGDEKTVDFSYLKKTNRIKVVTYNVNDDGNEQELCETRIIDDVLKVKKITSKIQTHTHNWQHGHFSPPWTSSIGRLSPILLGFYNNEMIEVTLTIGYLDGFGYYLQHPVDHLGKRLNVEEVEEMLSLIEIDKEVVDNQTPCN